MFDDLEPTMVLERCAICSAIPKRCYREHVSSMVADYDVEYGDEGRGHDDIPAAVDQLETWITPPVLAYNELKRCPTCRRLYLHRTVFEHIGPRTYSTKSYDRVEVGGVQVFDFFRHHTVVRFREASAWFFLDDANHLAELDGEELAGLIARDPPTGLDDAARALRYVLLVGELEDPEARVIDSFAAISWRDPLTDEDREQIETARAASRVAAPAADRVGDQIVVTMWVISSRRLICRVVTVGATGETVREDAVVVENLPVEG